MSSRTKIWIEAMRPRTLPLALASIGMGAFLAAAVNQFNGAITLFAMLTTLFLQILSNLANDYGDTVHGADSDERAGPKRAVQAGLISKSEMKRAMMFTAALSMISGTILVWLAFGIAQLPLFLLFIGLGAASIWAAVNYTAGNNPYGYAGLGDLFVFIFFGLLGVMGTVYLQTKTVDWSLLLPAASYGVFAVAVLNINNIRDIESDVQAGKNSIPVRLGVARARLYHWALLVGGLTAAILWTLTHYTHPIQFLFLVVAPFLAINGVKVGRLPANKLDPLLKQMVLTALLFVITFGVGQIIASSL